MKTESIIRALKACGWDASAEYQTDYISISARRGGEWLAVTQARAVNGDPLHIRSAARESGVGSLGSQLLDKLRHRILLRDLRRYAT